MNASTIVGRGRRRARFALIALATSTALGATLAAPAQAQSSAYRQLDANGVDLVRGGYQLSFEEGTIGSGAGRLSIVRQDDGDHSSQWDKLTFQRIQVMTGSGVKEGVIISHDGMASWESFSRMNGGAFTNQDQLGSSLTGSGGSYQYTASDGTVTVFGDPTDDPNSSGASLCRADTSQYSCSLPPLNVTTSGGVTTSFEYELSGYVTDPYNFPSPVEYYWRLSRVSNSANYAIGFTYADHNTYTSAPPPQSWYRRSGADFYNTAASSSPQASIGYGYTGPSGTVDITDTAGATWRVSSGSIRRPGESTPGFQLAPISATAFSITRDGVTTNYARSVNTTANSATTTVTDALSRQTTIVSDLSIDQPTSVTDYLGNLTQYSHDTAGHLTRITKPGGGYVEYTPDTRGNVVTTRQVASTGTGPGDLVSTAVYDPTCSNAATCNQPTSVTDAGGHTTDYAYNGDGTVASVTAPAPTSGAARPESRFAYMSTAAGTQLSGVSTCRTGSAPACVGTADETVSSRTYDSNGNVASVTTAAGDNSLSATAAATWSPRGDVVSVSGPTSGADETVTYRYDGARRQVGVISADPDGAGSQPRRATRITYDTAGRATLVEAGTVTGTSDTAWAGFSPAEGVATIWSGERKTLDTLVSGSTAYAKTQYGYDAAGRLECTAVRMNTAAWGTLPAACTAQTAGSAGPDRITRTSYDGTGKLTVSTAYGTPDQADEVTAYTADGQVASVTDAEGNLTSYGYDGFGRLSRTSYPSTTRGAGTSSTTDYEELGYDADSNVVSLRLRDARSIGFAFDALGRMTTRTLPGGWWGGDSADWVQSYQYDNVGHLVGATDPNNAYTTYGWDALGREVAESSLIGGTRAIGYDLAGRRTSLTWNGGFAVTYGYDPAGDLTVVAENGTTPLATYGYDAFGRRTGVVRGNGTTTSYSYDAVSRLASFGHDLAGTGADLGVTFGYNPAGQITSRVGSNDAYAWTGAVNGTSSYVADGLDRYATAGTVTPTYDARGNTTSAGGQTYGYNAANQLTTFGGGYVYRNALGQRLDVSTEGQWAVYDGDRVIEEFGYDNAVRRRYVYAPGEDTPLVWYEGAGTTDRRWLHTDERGSVIAVSDAGGNALAINTYDEYGQPASGNLGRFGYTGQQWIAGLGLWDYKARMYSPSLGRFMQTDPIGYGDGLNWYGYVGADPVNFTDPSGSRTKHCPAPVAGDVNVCGAPPPPSEPEAHLMPGDVVSPVVVGRVDLSDPPAGPDVVVVASKPQRVQEPSTLQCVGTALWDNKGVLALDALSIAASFVPGGKGLVTAGAAVVGSATGVAALGIGVANRDIPGAAIGAAGHYVSNGAALLEGAKGLAGNLPIAGQALAIGGGVYDVYNSLKEGGCLGGKK